MTVSIGFETSSIQHKDECVANKDSFNFIPDDIAGESFVGFGAMIVGM